jgi:spore coat protein CotH
MKASRFLLFGIFIFIRAILTPGNQLHAQSAIWPSAGTLFDGKLHRIDILMPPDSWTKLNKNVWDNLFFKASFVYDSKDTLKNIGIRVKGNTSREAERKGYRIDFGEFVPQTYQGLKNINLNGSHNDPSMMREMLSNAVMNTANNVAGRTNPVMLYVNGIYQGLRIHSEYIDKIFLQSRFGESSGNLFKCTWPADLVWMGNNEQSYKNIINPSPLNERAYELKTNETADDYSDLVAFIDIINNSSADSFASRIKGVFDVDAYLKVLAAEVLVGHWDNYFINKNNYFLYHRMSDNRFVYIPYDMDNTFGVQWGYSNINNRDIHSWGNSSSSKAPLTNRILLNNQWRWDYEINIRKLLDNAYNADSLYKKIDLMKVLLNNAVKTDPFFTGARKSDYGFTYTDWQNADTKAWGKHVSFGIKPFIGSRCSSALLQMKYPSNTYSAELPSLKIFPNPSEGFLNVRFDMKTNLEYPWYIYNLQGNILKSGTVKGDLKLDMRGLATGVYLLDLPGLYKPSRFLLRTQGF